ncbi:nicotinate phosphoribosyltransferase [Pseudomonas viridiflava]|uniref:nicotinate phosphoribosyltransferase n=1 Tax=Pseudomonas syringae group TaxID=136849 RepID=UPI0015E3800D|nr:MULTISPECIES: nicotinate phosphoribosyltransferase [Pseudomonas syringae group]MBA1228140.1 nicotinate phosphoribosyltransferase [Pseudomonas viridiflava]MCF5706407.1 nicotinate phosphoribosyltransferase [Pseudomonas syringae]
MESVYDFSKPIVRSPTDDDMYKLSMGQAIYHAYPSADTEWALRVRSQDDLTPYINEIREAVDQLQELESSQDMLRHLRGIPYISTDYIDYLEDFRLKPRFVKVGENNGQLEIRARGPWVGVSPFEVKILAIVSEIRNRHVYPDLSLEQVRESLYKKFDWLKANATTEELASFKVADFGTRRRISYLAQEEVVRTMMRDFPGEFVGTSNIQLAREFNIRAVGTQAHEWFQAHQQLGPRLVDSQKAALDGWIKEYRGDPGLTLADCINQDAFLRDFDSYYAKLFDGCRHDSGDPLVWGDRMIAHYESLRIDPQTKTLIFSDGLNLGDKALRILRHFRGRINVSFGIGTDLTNGVEGVKPLSIVMKMVNCQGQPVAKISDAPGKSQCESPEFLSYLKQVFQVKE